MQQPNGFIAFTSTLVISAVILFLSTTAALLAIGQSQAAFSLERGEKSLAYVEGCLESALLIARTNANYSGGTLSQPEGTCLITVQKSGTNWMVRAQGSGSTTHSRTVEAQIVRLGSGITMSRWREI